MSFLAPWFLIGMTAAAVPIVLHLLKRKPDVKVRFSAVHLLRQAPIEHASRRRLRELLLLALRVAALVLLAVAFARPFTRIAGAGDAANTTLVLLDTSLSLSAPGQFERAQARARQIVDEAPVREAVGVITFDDRATVVERPSTGHGRALAAIQAAKPGAGGTNYRAALDTAGALVGPGASRIVVVTDLQASAWDAGDTATIPASARVEVADVGAPPANLAVTRASVDGDRVTGTVLNTAATPVESRVTLAVAKDAGGSASSETSTSILVPAGGEGAVSFPRPDGAWATLSVADPDGIQGDNTRYVVLAGETRPAVLVLTATGDLDREAFYIGRALEAAGADGGAYRAEAVAANALQSWDQNRLNAYPGIVLMSTRGLEHHGRELLAGYLRKGGGLLVAGGVDVDADVLSEALGGLRVSILTPDANDRQVRRLIPGDTRHPMLQPFSGRASLGLATFRQVIPVRGGDSCRVVATFTSGESAVLDCEAAGGRAVLLAFDVNNRGNDFPLHPTFLPFVHETIRYLTGSRHPAELLVAEAPSDHRQPGIVDLAKDAAGPKQLTAVNVDPAEAKPARLTPEEFQSAVVRLKAVPLSAERSDNEEQEERQRLWVYALATLLGVLALESAIATRAG